MQSDLSSDLLNGVAEIAAYRYGDATKATIRRTRHEIAHHGLPVVQRGRIITSFKSWLREYSWGGTIEKPSNGSVI